MKKPKFLLLSDTYVFVIFDVAMAKDFLKVIGWTIFNKMHNANHQVNQKFWHLIGAIKLYGLNQVFTQTLWCLKTSKQIVIFFSKRDNVRINN